MRRDPTQFRKRFAAYKQGKMPYNAGKPIADEEYYDILERDGLESGSWTGEYEDAFIPAKWQMGLPNYQKGKRPTAKQIAGHAWATENPTRRGLNANGTWRQYPDPAGAGLMNVGPGALVNNAAAKKAKVVGVVPDKKSYTTAEVEQPWINNYNEGWPKIADSYDKKYGTATYPHPSDTINVKTQLLAVSTRGKNGSLRQTEWPAFYQAMADGDLATQLVESRTMFGEDGNKKYDNDRVRREAEALWPGMFNVSWDKNDPKKKTLVVPRKTVLK